jgi:hypothetical protein
LSGYWFHRTNKGRVIYEREKHGFSEADISRIVRSWSDKQRPDVLMMSDIADRILFWIGRRLGLDEMLIWAGNRIPIILSFMKGLVLPGDPFPKVTPNEQRLLDWMTNQALRLAEGLAPGPAETRDQALQLARAQFQSMIDWIDTEAGG